MSEALKPVSGTKTIAQTNTAEKLSTNSRVVSAVSVRVRSSTGAVRIGDSTVSASAWTISDAPVAFDVVDLSAVYVFGTAGDVVEWLALAVTST